MEDWGGRRKGAGRKVKPGSKKKERVTFDIETELIDWLNGVTDNKTEYINAALRLAREQKLVVVRTDKFVREYGQPEEDLANWIFVIDGKYLNLAGTYSSAKQSAIAAALLVNTRVVSLVGYEKGDR